MSNINKQTPDLFAIPGVTNIDQESAAAVSGGVLILSSLPNGRGTEKRLTTSDNNLGVAPGVSGFNNVASWYAVTGRRNWKVWTGINFTGRSRILRAGTTANFSGDFNNSISSAAPV